MDAELARVRVLPRVHGGAGRRGQTLEGEGAVGEVGGACGSGLSSLVSG